MGNALPSLRCPVSSISHPDLLRQRIEGILVTAAVRDISVRKNAEKHLAQMEGKYRGLLEAAPDAMVVVNEGGEIVLLNLQAEKQFGYRRDELLGQKVTNIIPEGFAERLIADDLRSAEDALAQQIGTGIELNGLRKDGSAFPIEIMLSPLQSAEGILVTAAIRDITARRMAAIERNTIDEALFEEKERAQVTLNSIGDAVACTDISGNITFLNLVAEKLTGWSRQEATGRPMADVLRILDTTNCQAIPDPMMIAVGQNQIGHLPSNCILVRRDGFEIPIEDSVAPIHDRDGQATGAVIVFRDVSAARAMALEMTHSAQHDFLTGLPNRMAPERPGQPGDCLGAASREQGRGAVFGSGWLQAHQRFSGPSDRRPTSSIGRQAPRGLRARLGHGQPAGRRRVRRAACRKWSIGKMPP